MALRISARSIRILIVSVLAPLLPVFFVPVTGGVDLNGVAAIGFAGLAVLYLPRLLKTPELFLFAIIPWFGLLLLSFLSEAMLSPRTSLAPIISQCIFLMAAIGFGFGLQEMSCTPRGPDRLMRTGFAMSVSFVVFLLVFTPLEHLVGLLTSLDDPVGAAWHARRLFFQDSFIGGQRIEEVTNLHNRVAQHLFAYAVLISTISLYAARTGARSHGIFYWNIGASSFLAIMSVILLSGQSLAEILILVIFCGLCLVAFRLTSRVMAGLLVVVMGALVSIPYIVTSSVGLVWMVRFSGGDISTGRTTLWSNYLESVDGQTLLLGSPWQNFVDPHNALLTALVETGFLGFLCVLVFLSYLLIRPLLGLRQGAKKIGLSYLMMMSVGFQIAFVLQIAGGWGLPGLAEWLKFSVFVLGVLISPVAIRDKPKENEMYRRPLSAG